VAGDQGIGFYPSHGDWIRLLRRSGFDIEGLIEVFLRKAQPRPILSSPSTGAKMAMRRDLEGA